MELSNISSSSRWLISVPLSRGRVATTSATPAERRRKPMSPAARRKTALAQKKRWAEWRKKERKVHIAG